jgi:K+-sensing histidine kinase KdpD
MAEVVGRLSEALRREREVAAREKAAAEKLRELDRMKDSILQSIAHDLQDPLSGILASSIALVREHGQGSGDTVLLTRGIASMARKVSRLIGEVLDAERLSRGLLDISPRATDVGELVRGLVEQRVLEGYPGLLSVEAESVWVSVDAAKVERAVDELLQHVVQLKKRRGPVRVLVRDRNGALVTVEDAGAHPLRPSEPNVAKLDPGDARASGASIPGLDYASTVARLHRGRLWAETHRDGSVSFGLWLPREREAPLRWANP